MITHLLRLTRGEWYKLRRRRIPWILLGIIAAITQGVFWMGYVSYHLGADSVAAAGTGAAALESGEGLSVSVGLDAGGAGAGGFTLPRRNSPGLQRFRMDERGVPNGQRPGVLRHTGIHGGLAWRSALDLPAQGRARRKGGVNSRFLWRYPDTGRWDADRNSDEFVRCLPLGTLSMLRALTRLDVGTV